MDRTVIVTPGHCGSSALVGILKELGAKTGKTFKTDKKQYNENAKMLALIEETVGKICDFISVNPAGKEIKKVKEMWKPKYGGKYI